jgi:ABC-type transport system substrate-binding protein
MRVGDRERVPNRRDVDPNERGNALMKTPRKSVLAVSVLGAMAAGGLFGATVLAPSVGGAATTSNTAAASSPSSSSQSNTAPYGAANMDPTKGGHTANGITETLLTGDAATKAKAAAIAAVPGGTVQRVENDAEGATYEAHMTKADGSQVTVKMDANFKVTAVETR